MKHKKLTMIVALVLVAALAAGLGIWATGEANIPTVTYYDGSDGTNAHFTFTHTGKGSDTNLFPNFSDCMPGDSLTQTIRVQADSKNGAQGAKIYPRGDRRRRLRQGRLRHHVQRCARSHQHDRVEKWRCARVQQDREALQPARREQGPQEQRLHCRGQPQD